MQPNAEVFMKQIVKACLTALFSIGVKSPQYIDKFVEVFSDTLDKNLKALKVVPQPQTTETTIDEPVKNAPQSSTRPVKKKVDISVPVK